MPEEQEGTTESPTENPPAAIPGPDFLRLYSHIDPSFPMFVLHEWRARERRPFVYAMTGQIIGGVLAAALIGGFIYLVMNGHGYYAAGLLAAGAISMVTGFRIGRY